MTRILQIRRGTAAQNNNFTGLAGEITMDTTNKTIRVHDGTTAGGTMLAKQSEIPDLSTADYVIASQLPTAQNNYTWYRKYKSGWIEQGGYVTYTSGTGCLITLPIEMDSAHYQIMLTGEEDSRTAGATTSVCTYQGSVSSTGFYVNNYVENGGTRGNGNAFWWTCCGVYKSAA